MAANETNIFQPLYKQDEHANVLRQQIIDWAREQTKRLEQLNVQHLLQALQVSKGLKIARKLEECARLFVYPTTNCIYILNIFFIICVICIKFDLRDGRGTWLNSNTNFICRH